MLHLAPLSDLGMDEAETKLLASLIHETTLQKRGHGLGLCPLIHQVPMAGLLT